MRPWNEHTFMMGFKCADYRPMPTASDSLLALSMARPDAKIAHVSSSVAEFGFARVLHQIGALDLRFSIYQSAIWHREDVHKLMANLYGATPPGRSEIQIVNITSPAERTGGWSQARRRWHT
jgi:hypothetical protein